MSDYFNYGFNEDTWKAYCEKQKRLRMGLEVSTVGSTTSKITVSPHLYVSTYTDTHTLRSDSSVYTIGKGSKLKIR